MLSHEAHFYVYIVQRSLNNFVKINILPIKSSTSFFFVVFKQASCQVYPSDSCGKNTYFRSN